MAGDRPKGSVRALIGVPAPRNDLVATHEREASFVEVARIV